MKDLKEKKSIKGFKNLFRYLSHFKKYKWLCIGFWISLLATGILSFFMPLVLGNIISHMTITQNFDKAIHQALIYLALESISHINGLIRTPLFKKLENYVKRDAKLEIIKETFNINIGEYEKLGNGTFVTRLTGDLDSLANSFKSISETFVSFMSKIGFIVFVFITNIWLGLFLIAFIIIRYLVYQIRMHYFTKMKPAVLRKSELINSTIGESVRGIKDIKTLGLNNNITNRVKVLQEDYMKADNKEWYVGTGLCTFADFVSSLCNFLFILLCVYLIGINQLELTIFYSVYIYKNNVMSFAVELGHLQDYFKEMEVNASRVFQLSSPDTYIHDKFGNLDLPVFHGKIEFKNVSFEYVKGEKILDDVSFCVNANNHIAFVGESGCGKSTIVALICKLYDPVEGTILFDDVNSRALTQDFGKNVSMVNQSPYLFNLTIRENMQLVKEDVTDDEIFEALKLANAYNFVKNLPLGLDSFLGEGGTRLSGGQKQRICIARALLKNSKVLIFDEATSALDNISQEYVIDSIEQLKQDKTIITIAHRLSTIENCDMIYFIDKGKIIDSGTHEYLLKNNKKYATLYNKQKKDKQNNPVQNEDLIDASYTEHNKAPLPKITKLNKIIKATKVAKADKATKVTTTKTVKQNKPNSTTMVEDNKISTQPKVAKNTTASKPTKNKPATSSKPTKSTNVNKNTKSNKSTQNTKTAKTKLTTKKK